MKEKRDKTVGKIVLDLAEKDHESIDVRDIRAEWQKDYYNKIESCIKESLSKFDGDFYVVVESKVERVLANVIRNFIFSRASCPTPHYDQVVYKYNRGLDKVEFIWCIPDKATCEHMRSYPLEYMQKERTLLQSVLDFYDETLIMKAMWLNGEVNADTKVIYD